MNYDLYIGDHTYSSWSMRGWLMLAAFDLAFESHMVGLYNGRLQQDLAALDPAPVRTVPALRTPAGHVLQDTLAMAETLHEDNPNAGLWPKDAGLRALARWITAEMHSGFDALRRDCPMNLAHRWEGFVPSDAVRRDLERLEDLWAFAQGQSGSDTWLFGAYSLADVFYAPIAARIAGYGLAVGDAARRYVDQHLHHNLFRQWRAMGLTVSYAAPAPYDMPDLTKAAWPSPKPLQAQATQSGPSQNRACPYSGGPATHFMVLEGKTWGFCNAFCRDKTVADPAAWPKFMELYQ